MWLARYIASVWARITALLGVVTAVTAAFTWIFGHHEVSVTWLAVSGWLIAIASWLEVFKQRRVFAVEAAAWVGPRVGSDAWLIGNVMGTRNLRTRTDDLGRPVEVDLVWPDGTPGTQTIHYDGDGESVADQITYEPTDGRPARILRRGPFRHDETGIHMGDFHIA